MFDVVQAEADLFGVLMSEPRLVAVNGVRQRKFQLEGLVNVATIYTTARSGKAGAGFLVEMPVAVNTRPNVRGPILDWVFNVVAVEQPTLNQQAAAGTCLTAEEIVQIVMDALHHYADERLGTFACTGYQFCDDFPACLAYRAGFKLIGKDDQTPRTGPVLVAVAAGAATLSCAADPTADIFYTLDGSFPANADGGNPASLLYGGPVPVLSGDTVRAVAYAAAKLNSPARCYTVP